MKDHEYKEKFVSGHKTFKVFIMILQEDFKIF